MLVIFGIILIVLSIFTAVGIAMDDVSSDGSFFRDVFGGGLSAVASIVGIIMIAYSYTDPTPDAIDVYRGKTELQIEKKIVNDKVVSSDSIVVWKK